jgi:hypothetical protein
MNGSRFRKYGSVLAVLVGTALLAPSPARAQDATTGASDIKAAETLLQALVEVDVDADLTARTEWLLARVRDHADQTFGATLKPVGDALRTQLSLPAGNGLLVASLIADGPSAQAGLKQNDILLQIADKPLAAADDLTRQLKAAGDAPVSLQLLRAGKPHTIQVRPVYHVTLGPVAERKTEYFIGVSIEGPDDALRTQLALPAGRGVLVTDVVAGSPSDKAGVKKYDIVLELADKPVDKPETLARLVQVARDKPTTLKLLRGGKPVTIPITGAARMVEASLPHEAVRFWVLDQSSSANTGGTASQLLEARWKTAAQSNSIELRLRLEALEKELKALHHAVDKVNDSLKSGKAAKPD